VPTEHDGWLLSSPYFPLQNSSKVLLLFISLSLKFIGYAVWAGCVSAVC